MRVPASLSAACRAAPGRVMAKSELARWPSAERGMELVDVELDDDEDELLLEESEEEEDEDEELVAMLERGLNVTGTFKPVDAMAADNCRLNTLPASITRMSTTTSDFGLSRSWITFSASAIFSASPRAMIANWLEYGKTLCRSATERTT